MPATEAALGSFRAADTQVLGVSIDSVYSHANWASSLGGVSFPLLSDFEPKGAAARALGHYLSEPGLTDRATVIVDKQGVIRYSVSVTPAGVRDISALATECEQINGGSTDAGAYGTPLPSGTRLFVKSNCGPSRSALLAIDNLHLADQVAVCNVSDDAAARAELVQLGGKDQAPCLLLDGEPIYESAVIVELLADRIAPLRH